MGTFGGGSSSSGASGHRDDRIPRSTVLTSQLPVSRWHEQIRDPTLADGILDRLVHNAHSMEMRGDAMRNNRPKGNLQG
jgi:DNA replication protein DnaC